MKSSAAGVPLQGYALSGRTATLKWLRKTHGWLGLWGATLGILFGVTGIVQNHRAIFKFPAPLTQESTVQIPLPNPKPVNPAEMGEWLQKTLAFADKPNRVKKERAHPVAWGDEAVTQPEHWIAMFSTPKVNVQAEYWVGNGFVTVKRRDNGVMATLSNLHKGVGVSVGWILLADSVAGSLIMLSLTGFAMWILTHRRFVIGFVIGSASLALSVGYLWFFL